MSELDFANWLLTELEVRGMSQAELARRARMSTGAVSNIVNGDRKAGAKTCAAIARAFGNAHLLGNAPIVILPPGVRRK